MSFVSNLYRSLLAFGLLAPCALATPAYSVSWDTPHFPQGYVDVQGYVTPGVQLNARAGIFGLRANGPGGTWDFMAVCVDPREYLFTYGSPQLYATESLAGYTSIPNASNAPSAAISLSAQRKLLLEQLFFVAGPGAFSGNSVASAAFQEAVWEIVGENLDSNPYNGDLNLGSGAVRITGSGDDVQVRNQANTYLSQLTSGGGSTGLTVWSPVREVRNSQGLVVGYERVTGQELLTPAPEPALYAVLALGLLAAFRFTRKRQVVAADPA